MNRFRTNQTYVNGGVQPNFDNLVYQGIEPLEGQMDSNTSAQKDSQGKPINSRLRDSERYAKLQSSHSNFRSNLIDYHQP